MRVSQLQRLVALFRDQRDWRQFHNPKDLALALNIEAGELAELFLWKSQKEVDSLLATRIGRERVADEMADVLSFLLSLADVTEIDLANSLKRKLKKNGRKYPVKKVRGKALKYTEYE